MVVVKVIGDLTINSGVTVSPYHSDYGGPKGFFIYCTGKLTNNGNIENNYGAKATGENVYLWQNNDGTYEFIPSAGASGGAKASKIGDTTGHNGSIGKNASTSATLSGSGVNRSLAGGGAGGIANGETFGSGVVYHTGSAGGAGSAYSGRRRWWSRGN